MSNNLHLMPDFTKTFKLPHWPMEYWIRYINSYIERMKDDDVASMLNLEYPGLVQALGNLRSMGLPAENVAGIMHGIVLCQFLHFHNYMKFNEPPIRENMVDL